jgi:hypothetical protein
VLNEKGKLLVEALTNDLRDFVCNKISPAIREIVTANRKKVTGENVVHHLKELDK